LPHLLLYIACPPPHREATEKLLAGAGFVTAWVDDVAGALACLELRDRCALVDFGDDRAPQIVREIRERRPQTLILGVADASRPAVALDVERSGIPAVLRRPIDVRMLGLLAGASGEGPAPAAGPGRADRHWSPFFADSSAMKVVVEAIRAAAASDAGVLVCGEPGAGRQLVARQVHALSARAAGPFVRLDCAEDGGEGLEARLFGAAIHPRDSGTPVLPSLAPSPQPLAPDRIGAESLLHQARGGTLFLADLVELPDRLQARLARVLRDGEVFVGDAPAPTGLRVRAVVSADPGWDGAVEEGHVRADLGKRVAGARIDVPPLRDRREDIPLLAAGLLREECEARRTPVKEVDPAALALLAALPWRGNGRELRALMATLAVHVPGTRIRLEDVLGYVRLDGPARTFVASGTLRDARARFEREYISAVLEHHRGRIGEAARELGIQRTNLYRKMRSLRLSRPSNGNGHKSG